MRKGQIQGQIFIYILAILVVSLVLTYGYRAIQTFMNQAEQVETLKFRTTVQNSIDSIRSEYGSGDTVAVNVPGSYDSICFVDLDHTGVVNAALYPIIEDSVSSGVMKNLFLVNQLADESFYVGKIMVSSGKILCLNTTQSRVQFRITGGGDHVEISTP